MKSKSLAFGLVATLVVSTAVSAQAEGALAIGFIKDGRFAWAARDRTDGPGDVESLAMAECKRQAATAKDPGNDCRIVLRYDNLCMGVAGSVPSGHRGGWSSAATIKAAEDAAMTQCQRDAAKSGESCKILGSFCDKD